MRAAVHATSFVDHHQSRREQHEQDEVEIAKTPETMEYEVKAEEQERREKDPRRRLRSLVVEKQVTHGDNDLQETELRNDGRTRVIAFSALRISL